MSTELKLGEYEHYKKKPYEVIGIAKHSETLEEFVVYKALYGDGVMWVRPKDMFMENIELDGKIIPRFKLIKEKCDN